MKYYSASSDVEAAFKPFLERLYTAAEDPVSTTGFTDYFPSDGSLIVLKNIAVGATEILALKRELLPVDGSKHWDHFPNTTTLYSRTTTQTTYQVWGTIQTTYNGGNCSQAYYQSHFTVLKDPATGVPNFMPLSRNLKTYDDYVVSPDFSPTDIECSE